MTASPRGASYSCLANTYCLKTLPHRSRSGVSLALAAPRGSSVRRRCVRAGLLPLKLGPRYCAHMKSVRAVVLVSHVARKACAARQKKKKKKKASRRNRPGRRSHVPHRPGTVWGDARSPPAQVCPSPSASTLSSPSSSSSLSPSSSSSSPVTRDGLMKEPVLSLQPANLPLLLLSLLLLKRLAPLRRGSVRGRRRTSPSTPSGRTPPTAAVTRARCDPGG